MNVSNVYKLNFESTYTTTNYYNNNLQQSILKDLVQLIPICAKNQVSKLKSPTPQENRTRD